MINPVAANVEMGTTPIGPFVDYATKSLLSDNAQGLRPAHGRAHDGVNASGADRRVNHRAGTIGEVELRFSLGLQIGHNS